MTPCRASLGLAKNPCFCRDQHAEPGPAVSARQGSHSWSPNEPCKAFRISFQVEEVLDLAVSNPREADQHLPGKVVVFHQTEDRHRIVD